MPKAKPDPERVAAVLVTAMAMGDKATARQFGISVRTIQRYKDLYGEDPVVAQYVAEKRRDLSQAWGEKIRSVAGKMLDRMNALAEQEEDLAKVTGAFKVLSEFDLAERVIHDRLADEGTGPAFEAGPLAQTPGTPEHVH